MDDRLLAHLQMVIGAKLRKGEAFLLSGAIDPERGSGRYAAWIDSGIPIFFRFEGSRPVAINRVWLEAMLDRSYTIAGLEVMPESEYLDKTVEA